MKPSAEFVGYLLEALARLGDVDARRFFGGTALLLEGVQFAFVMKGSLYLRVDGESRREFEALGLKPFRYATRARAVDVASYYGAPAAVLDDPEALCRWARRAHVAARRASPGHSR
jgi:DNA transformation protein